jgi:hypothetical protein
MINIICGIALSVHVGLQNTYNPIHPYCKVETTSNVIFGAYYNSVDRMSVFGGYEFKLNDNTSLELVAVTGYYEYEVVPTIRFNYKDVWVMPALEEDRVGLVVGWDYKF